MAVFNSKNSFDRLAQVIETLEIFKKDSTNFSLAEKCVFDLWHIADWYTKENKIDIGKFRINNLYQHIEMKILDDLTNTIKHKELRRAKLIKVDGEIKAGAFSNAFSSAFDTSRIEIHYQQKDSDKLEKIEVIELIERGVAIWEGFFRSQNQRAL